MLNLEEIDNTIAKLENEDTTFANCDKLATLYIVREHFNSSPVIEEYNDILPSYSTFCDIKRHYQMGETDKQPVLTAISKVCKEINEFLLILYKNTDMQEERDCIKNSIYSTYTFMN